MQLSNRIQRVAASATMAMTQAARDKRASGQSVISLSVGEPDFATPTHIIDAATRAMTDGHTGYTAADGIAELKQAIVAKFARDNGLTYTPAQINVSPGVKLTGATPIILQGGADFKIKPEQLEAAITPATRWLMLNSPSNPTGAVYSAEELSALADVLRRHPNVMVLTDDIYEALVFGGAKFATMASVAPDLIDRTLTMNGVSKAYAMTGFRIGYGAGPEWLISAMRKFMGQTTSNPCSISQWASVAALNGPQDFLHDWRAQYRARGEVMTAALNAAGLACTVPDGAFYVFADCKDVMAAKGFDTDADLAMAILNDAGVATVPGSAFYAPGHLRLSYAASIEGITQACSNVAEFCSN
jgi:aspartate aminotransferase